MNLKSVNPSMDGIAIWVPTDSVDQIEMSIEGTESIWPPWLLKDCILARLPSRRHDLLVRANTSSPNEFHKMDKMTSNIWGKGQSSIPLISICLLENSYALHKIWQSNLPFQSDYCVSYFSPSSVFLHPRVASVGQSNIFSSATCVNYTPCWIHPFVGIFLELSLQNKCQLPHGPRNQPKNSSKRECSNQIAVELPNQKETGAWAYAQNWFLQDPLWWRS